MSADASDNFDPRRHRVELIRVDVDAPEESDEARVEVLLRAGSKGTTTVRTGPSSMAGLLDLSAEATLEGVQELVPNTPDLEVASVDRVLGGGFDVLLVVVQAPEVTGRPLAGAIPVVDADPHLAAAAAALDAVNRVVGRGR